jgi:hypothetical protein
MFIGQPVNGHEGDHTMPTSNNAYFSPQTAFYDQSMPGGNLLANNPLINTALQQGATHFASNAMHVLSDGVKIFQ